MAVSARRVTGEKADKFFALHANHEDREVPVRFGSSGCVLTARYEASAQAVKDFAVREDDVWVITPPKCGTTWTQEMVWLLMNGFDYEGAKTKLLAHRFPYLEFSRFMSDTKKQQYLGGMDTLEYSANLSSPRCIKSHLPKDLLPVQLNYGWISLVTPPRRRCTLRASLRPKDAGSGNHLASRTFPLLKVAFSLQS